MLALTIKDTKLFMSKLLVKDTFDSFLLSEAIIKTACSYTISGEVNRDFYTSEEWEQVKDTTYVRYKSVKEHCFHLIKGSKVPLSMKMVFLLPDEQVTALLEQSQTTLTRSDINGLFVNMKYRDGKVTFVTGTSFQTFTMDKSLEHIFDTYIKQFLAENGMDFEEN